MTLSTGRFMPEKYKAELLRGGLYNFKCHSMNGLFPRMAIPGELFVLSGYRQRTHHVRASSRPLAVMSYLLVGLLTNFFTVRLTDHHRYF